MIYWQDMDKNQKADMIRQVWSDNMSAGQIAARISRQLKGPTVSRQSVLGLYNRDRRLAMSCPLGGRAGNPNLKDRERRPRRQRGDDRRKIVKGAVYEPAEPPREPVTVVRTREAITYDEASLGLPLADLPARGCRWPVNDSESSRNHLFCGHPAQDGSSYCEHHHDRSRRRGPLPSYLKV